MRTSWLAFHGEGSHGLPQNCDLDVSGDLFLTWKDPGIATEVCVICAGLVHIDHDFLHATEARARLGKVKEIKGPSWGDPCLGNVDADPKWNRHGIIWH